jgi:hypothetical protein
MISITVKEDKIVVILEDGKEEVVNMGADFIREHGFAVVDEIVDNINLNIKNSDVIVRGKFLEAKMVARKLEDRMQREVRYLAE